MNSNSRSRLLLSGAIALTLVLGACSKSSDSPVATGSVEDGVREPSPEATLAPAVSVSAELCAETTAIEAAAASTKGATVITNEGLSDAAGANNRKEVMKRAANGNMSLESEMPAKFDEATMQGALRIVIQTPEALYESYLPGYVESLKDGQWIREEDPAMRELTNLAEVFKLTDSSQLLGAITSDVEDATQTGVEAEDGLCKYSLKDTETSYTIAVDADGRLRFFEYETLSGYTRQRHSFDYSPVVIEAPPETDWAPDSVVEDVRARQQEF